MKLLIIILLVTACHKKSIIVQKVPVEKEVTIEKEIVIKKTLVQDFENTYYFENGGFIELVTSNDNEVTILRTNYSIVVENANSTLANMPVLTAENLEPNNNLIIISRDINYGSSSQYDLERDDNGSNITSTHRTDYKFELLQDKNLRLTITIYEGRTNNNINKVIFKRDMISF